MTLLALLRCLCSLVLIIGLTPVALLQPLLLVFRGTWEAQNAGDFGAEYTVEASICISLGVMTYSAAYHAATRTQAARRMHGELVEQVRRGRCLCAPSLVH